MFYWRNSSFDGLDSLFLEIKDEPFLKEYGCYINYLSKGLRKKSLEHAKKFITDVGSLEKEEQWEIVSFLCRVADKQPLGHQFVPQLFFKKIIEPGLRNWIKDQPDNPEPYRWTGEIDDLEKSLDLDPTCEETRYRFILRKLSYVNFEDSSGLYNLNQLKHDLTIINYAKLEVRKIADIKKRTTLYRMIQEDHDEIKSYIIQMGPKIQG